MNRTTRATPTVGDVMTTMPRSIGADQSIAEAWEMIVQLGVRHLPVTSIRGKLLGIVSERDLRVAQAISEEQSKRLSVGEIMVPDPHVVGPGASLSRVARAMAAKKQGCAIVVEHGAIVGIFTSTDALCALADIAEGKAPRPQALVDVERRPPRGKTRRPIREIAAV